jgi:benzoylsuccinyl-CoA thiolase BbsA subunit
MTAAALSADTETRVEYFPPSKPWRLDGDELHLVGMVCTQCGTKAFPLREVCSSCGSEKVEPCELSAGGTLYSFSEVHAAPKGFAVPYVVAYVDLDDGVRLFGQVEGPGSKLALDQKVTVVLGPIRTRNDGTQVMSYKFRGQRS